MWPLYGYWRPWWGGGPGHWGHLPWGWPWEPPPPGKEQEIAMLEAQAEVLEAVLQTVRKRLEALGS
jgi:hypothetical protein